MFDIDDYECGGGGGDISGGSGWIGWNVVNGGSGWSSFKLISAGFIAGYLIKTLFGMMSNNSAIKDSGNTLYLIDSNESGGIYNTLFSSNNNNIYKQLYEQLNLLPEDKPVNIVIQTYGGEAVWCLKICETIKNRKGLVRAYVKNYAYSAGSVIALAADELYMTKNASLSAIDPQMSPLSILSQIGMKTIPNLLGDNAKEGLKASFTSQIDYYKSLFSSYINERYDKEKIINEMFVGAVNHEHIFFARQLMEWTCGFDIKLWDGNNDSTYCDKIEKEDKTIKII